MNRSTSIPAILTTHIVGMCVFAGLVIMMDLRLLGIGNNSTSISQIQRRLFPWQMVGMTISAVSGLVLVYGQPMRFYPNVFFWIKTVMMLVAGANVAGVPLRRLPHRGRLGYPGQDAARAPGCPASSPSSCGRSSSCPDD